MDDTRKDIFKKIHERCFQLGSCNYKETGCSDCPINVTLVKVETLLDKQEQGLLIELPCKVGTVIYIVNRYWHSVEIGNICGFAECDDVCCFCYKVYVDPDTYIPVAIADFGVEWFLTEAEAEEALAKMGGKP